MRESEDCIKGYIFGITKCRDFILLFDQDQEGWDIKFDRETVLQLAKGINAMLESAEKRLEK